MGRWILAAALSGFWLASCGGAEDEITGICLYDDGVRPGACRNLWNDDATCPAEGAVSGSSEDATSCSESGFASPCTHDHPASLWVADAADCAEWDE